VFKLAAIAVGTAPQNYQSRPEVQANVKSLREYLAGYASKESLLNRVSAKLPGTVKPERIRAIIEEIFSKQQDDGGWSLTSLIGSWKRHDGTPLETMSDGYATGLAIYVLEQVGFTRKNLKMNQGLSWLVNNQDKKEGRWLGYSLNKNRDPSSDTGPFMNDAATASCWLLQERSDPQGT
jgi:squalene-hopene/tetraprenyl-beta-curcumene cyclase